jgi:hypothetical protein
MKVPHEFTHLVTGFHADSNIGIETVEEWIASVVRDWTTPETRKVVRAFLDEVLSGDYSDEELEDLWMTPGPSVNLSKGGHRHFLAEIRKALDRKGPEKRKR